LRPETRKHFGALGERLDGGDAVLRRIRADNRPLPGTQLIREYDGAQHVVTLCADDFEFEGRPYRSVSAIARHITGTRWNGCCATSKPISVDVILVYKIDRLSRSWMDFAKLVEVMDAHGVILNGRQPEGVTLPGLLEGVPAAWGEQRLGRASASGGMGY